MAKQVHFWSRPWALMARRHPSAFLLAAQLLSLLLYPIMDDTTSGRMLFGAVALVVVPLTVWVVAHSPSVRWVAWMLAIPAVILTIAGIALDQRGLLQLSAVLEAALYFYAAEHGVDEAAALEAGMADKAAEFRDTGAQVYREA